MWEIVMATVKKASKEERASVAMILEKFEVLLQGTRCNTPRGQPIDISRGTSDGDCQLIKATASLSSIDAIKIDDDVITRGLTQVDHVKSDKICLPHAISAGLPRRGEEPTSTANSRTPVDGEYLPAPSLYQVADLRSPFKFYGNVENTPSSLDEIPLPYVALDELDCCEIAYRMLGNGSHSTVYKGRFRGIDRFVVVKLFELAEDGETLKLVLDEFRIMMLLQDTMVAPTVFGIVQNDRSLSAIRFVHESVTGMTTLNLLLSDKYKQMSRKVWMEIAICIVHALRTLHMKCVLLNSVTSSNIKVTLPTAGHALEIKLVDFGIATFRASHTFSEDPSYLSQFPYLAPEVKLGYATSPSSDVYGFGNILLEIKKVSDIPGLEEIASVCMDYRPEFRPTTSTVSRLLETMKMQMVLDETWWFSYKSTTRCNLSL